jgi:hypothetical protein
MVPGIEVSDGARRFTIAPMNLRILLCEPTKDDVDRISKGAGDDPASFQEAAINLLVACGRRNHPELTRDDILDTVDAGDLGGLIVRVMTKSGMTPRPLAVPPANPQPEPKSLAASSAQPDGSPTTSSTA